MIKQIDLQKSAINAIIWSFKVIVFLSKTAIITIMINFAVVIIIRGV